jgi:hypothetical protein
VKFWIFWGFDALLALVIVYFFLAGQADGSVSGSNLGLWLVILLVVGAVLFGSLALRSSGRVGLGILALLVLALPGLLFILFFGLLLIINPRWN